MRWDEAERRHLEYIELRLAHILRLLEAPDLRLLMRDPRIRQSLFLDLSESLRTDILELAKMRGLGIESLTVIGLFWTTYYLLRWEERIHFGRKDLNFLSGLELTILRGMSVPLK